MENTVGFAVRDNNNFYKIDISRTLLHFIEYDFTYFWEQCIEAGRIARKTGRLPQNAVMTARAVIARAHPYIEACVSTDYSEIVTDCIIEYICHSDRIGLEELWARCISPKNMYESAIFRRISEYKTSRAMNRWTSIVRLQEYAQNKVEFIFGPENDKTILRDDVIRARKEYFDLALSVAANELGCPPDALPSVKLCNPATVPNAAFAVGKVAKTIYRRYSDVLSSGRDMSVLDGKNNSKIQDQAAMEAYAYIKNMTRPGELDMRSALEAVRVNPAELYLPDSLKAAIDLEFELMCSRGIYLRKCEDCGRYFTATDDDPRCDRVNSSGKTCRRQYQDLCESIAVKALANAEEEKRAAAEAAAAEASASETSAETVSEPEYIDVSVTETVPVPEPPAEPVSYTVPKEMEKRGQKLYNALYKRVGRGIDENEFREWSQYLSNMKRNIKAGEATTKQFEDFLNYSDKLCEEVKRASKNKTNHVPADKPYGRGANSARRRSVQEDDLPEQLTIGETIVIPSSENVAVKPFVPQAFDSLFDAYAADSGDQASEKDKKVEIKEPKWERLTREDVYGKDKK